MPRSLCILKKQDIYTRALRMTPYKSTSSAKNVRNLKLIVLVDISSLFVFSDICTGAMAFSHGANGFLDVILRAPVQMSVFRKHGTVGPLMS